MIDDEIWMMLAPKTHGYQLPAEGSRVVCLAGGSVGQVYTASPHWTVAVEDVVDVDMTVVERSVMKPGQPQTTLVGCWCPRCKGKMLWKPYRK